MFNPVQLRWASLRCRPACGLDLKVSQAVPGYRITQLGARQMLPDHGQLSEQLLGDAHQRERRMRLSLWQPPPESAALCRPEPPIRELEGYFASASNVPLPRSDR